MGRDGVTDARTKVALRRRLHALEARAGIGAWRPNDWPIPDKTVERAIAVLREHIGVGVLRRCLDARPEDGGPAA